MHPRDGLEKDGFPWLIDGSLCEKHQLAGGSAGGRIVHRQIIGPTVHLHGPSIHPHAAQIIACLGDQPARFQMGQLGHAIVPGHGGVRKLIFGRIGAQGYILQRATIGVGKSINQRLRAGIFPSQTDVR